eukprot:770019-Lingulodinium_polyedra.AAC.1
MISLRTTLPYAAPELLSGEPCPYSFASDVWAAGVLCVEMLSDDARCYQAIPTGEEYQGTARQIQVGAGRL